MANHLTPMIERLPKGAVFSIDAPWGDGKSWFGRSWHDDLRIAGYKTIYIDTFASDYMEDPFFLLTGELSQVFDDNEKQRLKQKGARVGKALLPFASKIVVNALGSLAGTSNLADQIGDIAEGAGESAAKSLEDLVADRLSEYENEKKSVSEFKAALSEFADTNYKKTKRPIIIFVDELDRCKPDFAVKTIERIKHFFDINHLIFVLLLNNNQMQESIRGIYGANIDAERYLGKFVQFSLTLPKSYTKEGDLPYKRFAHQRLHDYGFSNPVFIDNLSNDLALWARAFALTLRDVERCIVLISLNNLTSYNTLLIAFIASLKVGDLQTFRSMNQDFEFDYQKMCAWIYKIRNEYNIEFCDALIKLLESMHTNTELDLNGRTEVKSQLGLKQMNLKMEYLRIHQSFDLKIN